MGTISPIGLVKPNTLQALVEARIKETIENGKAGDIFGVENPFPVPNADDETKKLQTDAINSDTLENYNKIFEECFNALDKIPEAGVGKPFGIVDPTAPLLPVITNFIEIIGNFNDEPVNFITEKLPSIIANSDDFLAALAEIPDGNTVPLAELIHELDENIPIEELQEKLKILSGEFNPSLSLPDIEFAPDFPSIILDPLSLDLPIIPTGFVIPDPKFPNINFAALTIFMAFVDAMKSVIGKIGEFIQKILSGIGEFIKEIVSMLIELIVEPLVEKLGDMLKSLLFAAFVATLISLLIGGMVVALIGFIMGAGLVAFSTANLLGLLPP